MKIAYAAASLAAFLTGAALAEPAEYEFDRTHTTIKASWDHLGYSTQSIVFTDYDGVLLLDLEEPSNSTVDVTFNLAGGFWVGPNQEGFEGHLNSADLFNTELFPTARFVATRFETEDGETGVMTGDLTLLGETRPVSLDVTLNSNAPHPFNGAQMAGFSASGVINRSEWGMGFAVPAVSDALELSIETELRLVVEEDEAGEAEDAE
ncbi:MAG: YceI family protein [Pseudomonadota bacterium]